MGLFSDPPKPSTGLFVKPKISPKDEEKPKEPEKKYTSLFGGQKQDQDGDKSNPIAVGATSTEKSASSLFGVSKSGPLFSGTKTLFGGPSLFSKEAKFSKVEDPKHSFISSGSKIEEEEAEGDAENAEK